MPSALRGESAQQTGGPHGEEANSACFFVLSIGKGAHFENNAVRCGY